MDQVAMHDQVLKADLTAAPCRFLPCSRHAVSGQAGRESRSLRLHLFGERIPVFSGNLGFFTERFPVTQLQISGFSPLALCISAFPEAGELVKTGRDGDNQYEYDSLECYRIRAEFPAAAGRTPLPRAGTRMVPRPRNDQ